MASSMAPPESLPLEVELERRLSTVFHLRAKIANTDDKTRIAIIGDMARSTCMLQSLNFVGFL